jgi:chondroitin AC lyase
MSNDVKVRLSSQGMVMLRMDGKQIQELSVSDPSRKLKKITLTVSGVYGATGDGFHVVPNRNQNLTDIVVDLPQGVYAGKSVTIEL